MHDKKSVFSKNVYGTKNILERGGKRMKEDERGRKRRIILPGLSRISDAEVRGIIWMPKLFQASFPNQVCSCGELK